MITEALQHCAGIGPVRLARLHKDGIRSWRDILLAADRLPAAFRQTLLDEARSALAALEGDDIRYFVDRFRPCDKWRILAQYRDQTSFFDIETTGLEIDATISVIVCWHRGQLHTFVEHENLDDFLDLLDDCRLLASFNGSTFDVPRVLDAFHIPKLPCPHLDLRWPSYHRGWPGSLKQITRQLGISRPADLNYADGEMAVQWWYAWLRGKNPAARQQLIRYCAADVLMLVLLSEHLAQPPENAVPVASFAHEIWAHLPQIDSPATVPVRSASLPETGIRGFGNASPLKLRARRRRL